MSYLFEGMTRDAGAFFSEKGNGGVRGSRMCTEENKIAKAGRPCSWDCYEKIEKYCYSEIIFFLKF
jgi:hypothetical protein